MQKIKATKTVFWDVDNTLIFSNIESPCQEPGKKVMINNRPFFSHYEHCEMLKDFKARAHTIVVWSAGGEDWAESVIKALDLTEYVDIVISKPDWFFDDKPASEWLGEDKRTYIDLK